jgi:excisionase family DNA binding protein
VRVEGNRFDNVARQLGRGATRRGEPPRHRADPDDPDTLIGVAEAAALLAVTVPTCEKWVRQGRIPAHVAATGGPYRVRRGDVVALRARWRLPVRPTKR